MKKYILLLFLIPNLFFAQVKSNKGNNPKAVYQNKLYYKYNSIMLNELKKNSYQPPSESVFIEKVYNYFGIDITKSKFDDVLCENNNYLYSILKKGRFADFIQIDRDFEKEADEVLHDIFITNSSAKNEFIEFNKIIFNDNSESINAVLDNEESINLLVVYYDYENNDLIKRYITNLKNESSDYYFKEHILFYNKAKGERLRKNLLEQIMNEKPEYITLLINFLKYDYKDNLVLKNNSLDYLISMQNKRDPIDKNFPEKIDEMKGYYKMKTMAPRINSDDNIEVGFIFYFDKTKVILSQTASVILETYCEGQYVVKKNKDNTITLNYNIHQPDMPGKPCVAESDLDEVSFQIKKSGNEFYIKSQRFLKNEWQKLIKE